MAQQGGSAARAQNADAAEAGVAAVAEAFERFIALEAAYDPALVDLYAEDGVLIEITADPAGVRRLREIPLKRYRRALPFALALSRRAGERAFHREIRIEPISEDWIVVRTMRTSSQSRKPAPYEAAFRREADGAWRVVKEVAVLRL